MPDDAPPQRRAEDLLADLSVQRDKGRLWTEERLLKFLIFGLFLLFSSLTVVFFQQSSLDGGIASVLGAQDRIAADQQEIIEDRVVGRENGFKNRSITCMSLVVDNDRDFALPTTCTDDEILKYYPPRICADLGAPAGCGYAFDPSPYNEIGPSS